jgi:glycosyltransferase involved in cell wall biosynthesis
VPYKRIDLAVAAANQLKTELSIYGNGPEHEKLVGQAGPTVKFIKGASDQKIAAAFGGAKAFVFPAEEDFGIVQIEALAAGCPVIAYGQGGALDIVANGKTGVLFDKQTVKSLVNAIKKAETTKFKPSALQARAKDFDENLFVNKVCKIVTEAAHRS